MATLKGIADLAATIARDRQAFVDQTIKLARSFESPVPEIPDISMPEITPLAEQIADLLKPQGTPRHTIETRGRKPKWDWERAGLAVLGRIYRGELPEPKSQGEVEARLSDWFSATYDSATPGETQIRERARLIWREISEVGN